MSLGLLCAGRALAQPVALELDTAPPGDAAFIVQAPDARGARTLRARLILDVAREPLVLRSEDQSAYRVVSEAMWLHGAIAATLGHRWLLAVHVPMLLSAAGQPQPGAGEPLPAVVSPSLGDPRLTLRARLLGPAGEGFQLGAGAELWAPTGDQAGYGSDGDFRARGFVVTGARHERFYWSAESGVYFRPEQRLPGVLPTRVGPALTLGMALGFAVDARGMLRVGPEAQGIFGVGGGAKLLDPRSSIVHVLLGARLRISGAPLEFAAGLGPGIGQGAGSADFRTLAAISWSPEEPPPPPDRDGDRVPDESDICLNLPGVRSDDPLMNGCPELPLDSDGDSIPDAFDACPRTPGEPTADKRNHGCPRPPPAPPAPPAPPPPAPATATLEREAITISEQVQFETGTAVLRAESDRILGEVAKVLRDHPELRLVEVSGHTDDTGTRELNQRLSEDRAASVVRWLVEHGIEASRLVAKGYGQDRPRAENTYEEGKAQNRRVEFRVLEGPSNGPGEQK